MTKWLYACLTSTKNLMGWLSIKFITEKQRFQVHAFVILNILLALRL